MKLQVKYKVNTDSREIILVFWNYEKIDIKRHLMLLHGSGGGDQPDIKILETNILSGSVNTIYLQ